MLLFERVNSLFSETFNSNRFHKKLIYVFLEHPKSISPSGVRWVSL